MMIKPVRIAAVVVAAAAMAFTCSGEAVPGLSPGDKAPMTDVSMTNVDGKEYTLEKLAGKKGLVVVFSCNTCPFVVGSETFQGWEKQYNALYRQAADAQIGFVLVNSNAAKRTGDDSPEAMKAHAMEKAYEMPYVVDENAALADALGAKTTPHVYFFNEKMELIYHGAIDNTVDSKRKEEKHYLQTAMRAHVSGQAIPETSTPPRGCSIKRT